MLIVLVILGLADKSAVHDWRKLVRWAERLQEANEEKENNQHGKSEHHLGRL